MCRQLSRLFLDLDETVAPLGPRTYTSSHLQRTDPKSMLVQCTTKWARRLIELHSMHVDSDVPVLGRDKEYVSLIKCTHQRQQKCRSSTPQPGLSSIARLDTGFGGASGGGGSEKAAR